MATPYYPYRPPVAPAVVPPKKGFPWGWILLGALVIGVVVLLVWALSCGGSNSLSGGTTTGTGTRSGTGTGFGTGTGVGTGTGTSSNVCVQTSTGLRLTSNGVNQAVTVSSTTSQLWTQETGSAIGTIRLKNTASGLYFTARDSSGSFANIMVSVPEAGSNLVYTGSQKLQTIGGLFLTADASGSNVYQIAASATALSWTFSPGSCTSAGTGTGTGTGTVVVPTSALVTWTVSPQTFVSNSGSVAIDAFTSPVGSRFEAYVTLLQAQELCILLKLAGFCRKFSPGSGVGYTQFFATTGTTSVNADWETHTVNSNTNPGYSSYVPPTIPISDSLWTLATNKFTTQSVPILGWTIFTASNQFEGMVDSVQQAKNLAVLHRLKGFRTSNVLALSTQWFDVNSAGIFNPDWNTYSRA